MDKIIAAGEPAEPRLNPVPDGAVVRRRPEEVGQRSERARMLIHPAEHWPARRSPQFGYRMRGRRSISELLRPSQESSSSLKGQFVTCENRNGSTREEVDSGKGCPGFWKKLQPLDRAPRGERSGRDPVQPARRSASPPVDRPEELITPPVYYY